MLNRHSSRDSQGANKHVKRWSTSSVLGKHKSKPRWGSKAGITKQKTNKNPKRTPKQQYNKVKRKEKMLVRMWRNWNPDILLVGMDQPVCETVWYFFKKIKHKITILLLNKIWGLASQHHKRHTLEAEAIENRKAFLFRYDQSGRMRDSLYQSLSLPQKPRQCQPFLSQVKTRWNERQCPKSLLPLGYCTLEPSVAARQSSR